MRTKLIENYKEDKATQYAVISSLNLSFEVFTSIHEAVDYAMYNLDEKTEIDNEGFFVKKNPLDIESEMTIYNDYDNEDVFAEI